jgi:enamine deaminase RidA (YjgF/YER057c/UK114 family)
MKKLIFIPISFISYVGWTQSSTTPTTFSNPSSVSKPKGYSHASVIDLGQSKLVILSGQIALDSSGTLIGKDNLEKQTQQVFVNIRNILKEIGGSMNDVVKLNYYMLDVKQIQVVRNIRDKFINLETPPTSTLVQVSKLFRDDLLIEIEATAVIHKAD